MAVTLSGSEPPIPYVGSPVVWTATASDHGQLPVYQFRVATPGGQSRVVRDFSPSNGFSWDPTQEGSYDIQVTVKDGFSSLNGEVATQSYTAISRVVGISAVVSPTSNPLVAFFSAPPTFSTSIHVEFTPVGASQPWTSTAVQPTVPGKSTNFFVAGMLPQTTYLMRFVLDDGTPSYPLTFTTGAIPENLTFPTHSVVQPPALGADLTQSLVFHVGIGGTSTSIDTVATDLFGNTVWYYDQVSNAFPSFAPSVVPGGTVLLLGNNLDQQGGASSIREIDLAGNTLRETNVGAVNAELALYGLQSITDFNHDAQRLPNGDTAVLSTTYKIIRINHRFVQYRGDMVVVLDQNFQVKWAWDPFNYLDVRRLPTLGEGAKDWTHANSVAWSPADQNLVVSLRNQDWVIKINYANGAGDGHIIWRLGKGGDFRINSKVASPWFSHQHDATYINNTTLVLFDNGNIRQRYNRRANSRGQELILNEQTGVATLVVNADLGSFAAFTGSAQVLPNGNLGFDSPIVGKTIEVLPNGKKVYVLKTDINGFQYRSYLYSSLYGVPAGYTLPSAPVPRGTRGN